MIKTIIAKNCSELRMDKFIDCAVNNNKKALILRRGLSPAKEEDLNEAWLNIYQEYSDLSSDESGNAYLSLIKQKTVLGNKIQLIKVCIETLSYKRNLDLIKCLKSLGIKGTFNRKTFKKDLDRAIIQLKSLIGRYTKVERELLPFISGSDMTASEYYEILVVLSKFQGYRLEASQISVLEFVNILNSFKKWQTPKKSPK